MKLQPINGRVIVQPDEAPEFKGAIALVQNDEKPTSGKVIAVSPTYIDQNGIERKPTLAKGDHVYWGKFAGTTITVDEIKYLICTEDEIFAKDVK